TSGERVLGHHVSISHFSQNHADELDGSRSVMETVEQVASREAAPHVRTLLGSFLFRGDDVFKAVKVLSGGERSRVALARMLVRPANFLMLDEPTNHLDMQSQEVLQRALNEFGGTSMIVSHNRSFLDPVVTKVLEFVPGRAPRLYLGNVSDYLEKVEAERAVAERVSVAGVGLVAREATGTAGAFGTVDDAANRREQRRLEAQKRQRRAEKLKPLKTKLGEVEAAIATLEAEKAELLGKMQDPSFFECQESAKLVAVRFKDADFELEKAYSAWSKLEEEIEELES
ncbi:MAG: ATP-binding cassette domain-containing protein, partial [Verrucomicrobiales bacterium]|nr:ATP-binding cassette domain-containing protein [Verrucomicrobiales bacterium]